jgi:hypothetical protein
MCELLEREGVGLGKLGPVGRDDDRQVPRRLLVPGDDGSQERLVARD